MEDASSDELGGSGAIDTSGIPVLLDLGADKCVPCKAMAPILEEMKETFAGQLDVQFIDVWKDAAAASEHKVKIIPTQIFFNEDGKEIYRHVGFMDEKAIINQLKKMGVE